MMRPALRSAAILTALIAAGCAHRKPLALSNPPVCVESGDIVRAERVEDRDAPNGPVWRIDLRCEHGGAVPSATVLQQGRAARLADREADPAGYGASITGPHGRYLVSLHPTLFATVPGESGASAADLVLSDAEYGPAEIEPAVYVATSIMPDADRVRVFGPHVRAETLEIPEGGSRSVGGVRFRRSGGSIRVEPSRSAHFDARSW